MGGGAVDLVAVGDRLGNTDEFAPGPGTHVRNGFIHAAVIGARAVAPAPEAADGRAAGRPVLSVRSRGAPPAMPEPGLLVTAKVAQVTPAGVHCRILCVGPRPLDVEFKGLIR
jgi:exosome complex component CSL4